MQSAVGLIVIGDPGHSLCAPNSVSGSITVQYDSYGVEVLYNRTSNVVAQNVSGPGPYPVFGDVTAIFGNHS